MNFSAITDRDLAGKLLRLPLRFVPPAATLPILQGRLRGKKWIVGSSNHGCWLGSHEYDLRRAFEGIVPEGSVVFDIGAHVGFYTLLASVLVGVQGRVFAFEPSPRNVCYLKEHVRLNQIENVTVIKAAVSDCNGEMLFKEGSQNSTGRLAPDGHLRVKTVSVDEMVSQRQVPPPGCMKVDVEGGEMLVLMGAKFVLSNHHPTIFLETHGEQMYKESSQFLSSLGYKVRQIGTKLSQETNKLIASQER